VRRVDSILVEARVFDEKTRLVACYDHPSLQLRRAAASEPTLEGDVPREVLEILARTLGRPPTQTEANAVRMIPGENELRPFGAAHDFTYDAQTRVIVEADFLVPREDWEIVEPFPDWPQPVKRIALALAEETAEADGDDVSDVPVAVKTDPAGSQVLIDLAYVPGSGEAFELSAECLAVIDHRRLVGFFARLAAVQPPNGSARDDASTWAVTQTGETA
jgi:hypothetical protein